MSYISTHLLNRDEAKERGRAKYVLRNVFSAPAVRLVSKSSKASPTSGASSSSRQRCRPQDCIATEDLQSRMRVCLLFRCWEDIGDFTLAITAHLPSYSGPFLKVWPSPPSSHCFAARGNSVLLSYTAPDLRLSGSVPCKRGATLYSGSWVFQSTSDCTSTEEEYSFELCREMALPAFLPTAPYSWGRGVGFDPSTFRLLVRHFVPYTNCRPVQRRMYSR